MKNENINWMCSGLVGLNYTVNAPLDFYERIYGGVYCHIVVYASDLKHPWSDRYIRSWKTNYTRVTTVVVIGVWQQQTRHNDVVSCAGST